MGHNIKHWPSYDITSNNFNERIANNLSILLRKLEVVQFFELMWIYFFSSKKSELTIL